MILLLGLPPRFAFHEVFIENTALKDRQNQLKQLLDKTELSISEMQWLLSYLEDTNDAGLKQIMEQQFASETGTIPSQVSGKLLKAVHERLELQQKPVRHIISFKRIAIAASLLGAVLITGLMFIKNRPPLVAEVNQLHYKNDVQPGGNKATLTLSDGSIIDLDDAKNGTLTQQGNTKVIKLDDKLLYDLSTKATQQVVYNTISTPKGGQYQLELPDGSRVWLNASSSIHFPTSFVAKERRVEITGEAYFEVAKDAHKPFIVSVNKSEVQVMGTHFNVNAYDDENDMKTTLLEGAIQFVNGDYKSILQPGQQTQLKKDGTVKLVDDVDLDEVVAWKNGLFSFESAGIETIMRQLARWYDVEIEYRGRPDDLFVAEIRRDIKLSDALKALELTGKVKFEIEGKKIIVMHY